MAFGVILSFLGLSTRTARPACARILGGHDSACFRLGETTAIRRLKEINTNATRQAIGIAIEDFIRTSGTVTLDRRRITVVIVVGTTSIGIARTTIRGKRGSHQGACLVFGKASAVDCLGKANSGTASVRQIKRGVK